MDALRQVELVRGDILRLGAHHSAGNRLRVEEEVGEAAPAGVQDEAKRRRSA